MVNPNDAIMLFSNSTETLCVSIERAPYDQATAFHINRVAETPRTLRLRLNGANALDPMLTSPVTLAASTESIRLASQLLQAGEPIGHHLGTQVVIGKSDQALGHTDVTIYKTAEVSDDEFEAWVVAILAVHYLVDPANVLIEHGKPRASEADLKKELLRRKRVSQARVIAFAELQKLDNGILAASY